MSLFSKLLGISVFFVIISLVLYVLFGQITVRKLRKNPKTKHELGLEFASGWDILNVAEALSLPKSLIRKLKNSRLSFLYANTEVLHQHTNVFDRCLARVFFWLFMGSGFSMILLVLLNKMGVFD